MTAPGDVSGDEEAIRRLLATYCHTADDGRFDDWAGIWTEGASLTVMGHTHEGREALVAFITAALPPERRGKHLTTNSIVEVHPDRTEATVTSDFIFVAPRERGGFAVTQAGRYHDRCVRTPDGWRLHARRIELWGEQP